MKTYWISAFMVLMASYIDSYSQSQPCATDFKHMDLLKSSVSYRSSFELNEIQIDNFIQTQKGVRVSSTPEVTYKIPLVVHVLEPDVSASIMTDKEIEGMISRLNNQLRAGEGYGDSQNINIEFDLVQRGPDCEATTGIVRVDMSTETSYVEHGVASATANGIPELVAKSKSNWGNVNYYNLWIVNEIDSQKGNGVIGFAYFPGAGAELDGALMIADRLKSENSTLLAHEIGHALGVYHTFNGSGGSEEEGFSCTSNASPTIQGDRCADTEPMHYGGTYISNGLFDCTKGSDEINPCTGNPYGDLFRNIMNYVPDECAVLFTADQKDRMRGTLIKARSSLLRSNALKEAPVVAMAKACYPTVGNKADRYFGITSFDFDEQIVSESGSVSQDGYFSIDNSCYKQAEVSPDITYPVVIKTKNSNYVKVYIDYNNDGDFEDVGEEIGSGYSYPNKTFAFDYTVPVTGVLTNQELRMRVVCDPSSQLSACNLPGNSHNGSGQSEDYGIKINYSAARTEPCPANISLNGPVDNLNSGTKLFQSSVSITAVNRITGGRTILDGGAMVVLKPGFEVSGGAVFTAQIEGCVN
ncbi:M43 family zinc metalloprotease [uncultured Arcticibacterium sp.]|uniref:M43 family zinc metalloprotease n=1 Tax=uncultured Arcticibacterium sp. TaxID=2173042 RepID=UPI0030FA5972